MNLKDKRVLVTGASGFIGSHLVAALEAMGVAVSTLRHDLGSHDAIDPVDADVVFHLAALTDLKACFDDPVRAFEVNTIGTLKILQACKSIHKFVYISTLGVYGEPAYLPVDERHPATPIEPYAASKLAGEAAVQGYCGLQGIPFCIARVFNVYGRGQREDFVIPRLVKDIKEGGDIIIRNADSTRDFIHVDDVVSGLCAVAERGENDIYNIGTGVETSIYDLAALIARLAKTPVSLIVDEETDGGRVRRSRADTSHTEAHIGWSADVRLEEGIRTLLA